MQLHQRMMTGLSKFYKPATDGRFKETVAKDLGGEADVREVLGWLRSLKSWNTFQNDHVWIPQKDND